MAADIIIITFTFIGMLVVCGVDASRKRREYLKNKEVNG